MTSFVEILPEEHDADAFKGFDASTADFTIGNARALMWFSQLAYETHRRDTIDAVFGKWDFTKVASFSIPKVSPTGSFETCGLVGQRPDAIILAFAGTDPGVWQNLATDFSPLPRKGLDTHGGFALAATAAQSQIEDAVGLCLESGKPLFVTGHSLGAALAALAAKEAASLQKPVRPRAVYGFGMPRVGGVPFQASYDADLGKVTYRLVHGTDLVARVAPSSTGFRHVGRLIQCASGAKFDGTRPPSQTGLDEPSFADEFKSIFVHGVDMLRSGRFLEPEGLGTFGPLLRFLPPEIRDHLQDSYWKALSP
jgi:triacylglycerol lipase